MIAQRFVAPIPWQRFSALAALVAVTLLLAWQQTKAGFWIVTLLFWVLASIPLTLVMWGQHTRRAKLSAGDGAFLAALARNNREGRDEEDLQVWRRAQNLFDRYACRHVIEPLERGYGVTLLIRFEDGTEFRPDGNDGIVPVARHGRA